MEDPEHAGIMSARTKPLQVVEPVEVPQLVRTVSYDKPAPRSAVKMIAAEDAAKLFDILREEKKSSDPAHGQSLLADHHVSTRIR